IAQYLALDIEHGRKLSFEHEEMIKKALTSHQPMHVLLVELQGFLHPNMHDYLKAGGYHIHYIDHHESAETKWNKKSSVEQIWEIYNYFPTSEQYALAMRDRGGIAAVSNNLPVDTAEITSWVEKSGIADTFRLYRFDSQYKPAIEKAAKE